MLESKQGRIRGKAKEISNPACTLWAQVPFSLVDCQVWPPKKKRNEDPKWKISLASGGGQNVIVGCDGIIHCQTCVLLYCRTQYCYYYLSPPLYVLILYGFVHFKDTLEYGMLQLLHPSSSIANLGFVSHYEPLLLLAFICFPALTQPRQFGSSARRHEPTERCDAMACRACGGRASQPHIFESLQMWTSSCHHHRI